MGNTCKPMAVSFQCMTKSTTNKNLKKKNNTHLFSPMHQDPRHGLNGSCESFAVKVLSELNALNSLNAQLGKSSPPSSLMSLAEFLCGYRIHGSLLPQCQQ